MGNGFTVDTSTLTATAEQLRTQAGQADQARQTASGAEIGALSWGLLGNSIGLANTYNTCNAQLMDNLTKVTDYLTWAASTMERGAEGYLAADEEIAGELTGLRP